jgi:hypothetical protein
MATASSHPFDRPTLETLSPLFRELPPDAMVVRALASLPPFADWAHRPMPASLEQALIDLDRQQLMTVAAACLIRLTREGDAEPNTDAA